MRRCIRAHEKKGRSGCYDTVYYTAFLPLCRGVGEKAQGEENVQNAFGGIFQSAVDAVKESDAEKTQMQYLMATGQLDNPVALSMASTKYELSVSLLVQLRNRAVEAYNELMRISL